MAKFPGRVQPEGGKKVEVDDFKEELWSTVVKFGEPVLIGTGLHEKRRKGLLEKMNGLRKQMQDTAANPCNDSSTLNKKTDDKRKSVAVDDKNKTSNMIKNTNILEAREEARQESEKRDMDKKVESVMVVTTPPSKGIRSRKLKRETKEASPSADAVSEMNLKETAPMIRARENSGLQEQLSAQEASRGAAGNGSLDDSRNGG